MKTTYEYVLRCFHKLTQIVSWVNTWYWLG